MPSPSDPATIASGPPPEAGAGFGPPRPWVLLEASYGDLLDRRPTLALLPWGATEAHNLHLPHGTDVIEATSVAEAAAALATSHGARPIVLPAIPYGNDAQQLDQVATIHLSTRAALALLEDVAASLVRQGIGRLVIVNGHGGNDFKPLVRDVMLATGITIVVVDFFRLAPAVAATTFPDPGDHAGQLETSLILHLRPQWVTRLPGPGARAALLPRGLDQPGAWTPRPWSVVHPDTGSGDPAGATAARGRAFFEAAAAGLADLVVAWDTLPPGAGPFVPRGDASGAGAERSDG